MAAEILYLHDLEVEAIIPALIASIVGYTIYGAYFGFTPIFGAQPDLALGSPAQLLYYAALGVAAGLVGILYATSFYGLTSMFHRLRLPRWLKPALGGLLIGLLALAVPGALHMGYGWVQLGMSETLLSLPLWLVLLLPFAKILATSLSIGSGGSGGIFGPGMVIGGMLGASFWRLAHDLLPQVPTSPAPFVIVGMMALFGGIAHAPLAVMLMVAEMTGNLSLLAPAMIAVGISTALVGDKTIYRSQLPNRAASPAHRVRFSFPLLSALLVRDAMGPPGPAVTADAPLVTGELILQQERSGAVPVVNEHGQLLGVLSADRAGRVPPAERATLAVRAVMDRTHAPLQPDETLDTALERLAEGGASWAPVAEGGRLVGRLHVRDIITTYKSALERSVRRAHALPAGTALFEVRVPATSPLIGRTLAEAGLPSGALVVSVMRDGETIFARASTRLAAGDVATIVADPASEPALRAYLEGVEAPT
jgi:CIC family chloride channel protein